MADAEYYGYSSVAILRIRDHMALEMLKATIIGTAETSASRIFGTRDVDVVANTMVRSAYKLADLMLKIRKEVP